MITRADIIDLERLAFNQARSAMLSAFATLVRNQAATATDIEETTCALAQVMACLTPVGE